MDEPVIEHVSKIGAARRQLRTAIRMFFKEEDSVSTHTLATAAHELLRDITSRTGSFLKDADYIVPERRQELIAMLNAPHNFFKHANRDTAAILDFRPITTQYWLLDASYMYSNVTGRALREGVLFILWFAINNPNALLPSPYLVEMLKAREQLQALARGGPLLPRDVAMSFLDNLTAVFTGPNMD